jgi:hypothetical protein
MRVVAALLLLVAMAVPAAAESRGTRIAMAVALLDVTQEHCEGRYKVDEHVKTVLFDNFHEYDIAGLASLLSRPLNSFYEDFTYQVKQGRDAFCRKAPEVAAGTGYPVILAGGG